MVNLVESKLAGKPIKGIATGERHNEHVSAAGFP